MSEAATMTFPSNDLEKLLLDASEDRVDMATFLRELVSSPAWVPISGGTDEDPEIRTVRIEDKPYVRVFTSEEQARAVLPDKELINPALAVVLRELPKDWGVVVNPNAALGFTVGAQTIHALVETAV
jgi:hypothetical protein